MTEMIWSSYNCNEYMTGKNITHKYVLNLCCVNSFSSRNTHNTRKSPWELSTQCRHFIYAQYTSGVTSALFLTVGLTRSCAQFILWTDHCQWETHEYSFRVRFSLLILKSLNCICCNRRWDEIQKRFRCFTASFTSSKKRLTSYTVVPFSVCWVTCGHLDTVWKQNIKYHRSRRVGCYSLHEITFG